LQVELLDLIKTNSFLFFVNLYLKISNTSLWRLGCDFIH